MKEYGDQVKILDHCKGCGHFTGVHKGCILSLEKRKKIIEKGKDCGNRSTPAGNPDRVAQQPQGK